MNQPRCTRAGRALVGVGTALLLTLTGCSGHVGSTSTGTESEAAAGAEATAAAAAAASSVADTSWGTPTEPGTPNMEFTADGLAIGDDGCNSLSTRWRVEDGTIYFDEIGSTEIACGDSDTWLSALASARVSGDRIAFSDASGIEIGSLERADSTSH